MAFVSLVLGAIYLFRDSFMPYHAAALSKDWGELDLATHERRLKALAAAAAAAIADDARGPPRRPSAWCSSVSVLA